MGVLRTGSSLAVSCCEFRPARALEITSQLVERWQNRCVSLRDGTGVRARRNHTQACRDRMEKVIGGERVRRAAARREREIDERMQQEDARIAADGAPPASSAAPATGFPRSCTTSDVAED